MNPTTIESENGKFWSVAGSGNTICLKAPDNSARLPTNSIITVTATINTTQPSSTILYPISGYVTTSSNTCPTTGTALTGDAQLSVNATPTATISYAGSPYCASGTAAVTRTGQAGGTYSAAPAGLSIDASSGTINLAASAAGTYTVTYSFTNGTCANTTTTTVEVKALPVVAEITGSSTVCVNSTLTLANATTGGVWSSSNEAVATVSASGVVTGVAAGTATISYSVTTNGCTNTKTKSVSVNTTVTPAVTISSSATNNIACAGAPVTFTANPTNGGANPSYQWKVNGTDIQNATNATYTTTSLADGDVVSVVLTSSNTCASTQTATSTAITTTVVPAPVGGSVSAAQTICNGDTPQDLTLSGHTGTVVRWQKSGNASFSSAQNIEHTGTTLSGAQIGGLTQTTYFRAVVQSGQCDPAYSSAVLITVRPALFASISGGGAICEGESATLTVTGTPDVVVNYDFTGGGSGSVTLTGGSATITVATPTAPITYTLTSIEYPDDPSCSQIISEQTDQSATVTVNALPVVADITGSNTVCAGSTIPLGSETGNGVWSSSNTNFATVDPVTGVVTGVAAGTTTISYTVTQNGCTSAKTHSVTVNALPVVADITGSNTVCVGSTLTLANTTTGGVWSSSSEGVATVSASGVVTGKAAGTATISYSVTTNGCTNTKTKSVSVNATVTPAVTISSSATNNIACASAPVTFTANPTNGGAEPTYQWQVNGSNVGTGPTYTTSALANGDKVKVIMTSNATCPIPATALSSEITMIIEPNLTAGTISGYTTALCIGGAVDLNTSGSTGGTWTSSNTAVATVDAVSGELTAIGAGTSTIKYSIASGCGSPTEATISITVNPNVTAGTITGAASLCMGSPATLSTNGTSGGSWTSSNNAVATVNSSTGVVTPVAPGIATITYTVNSGCGAPVSTNKEFTVNTRPTATITSTTTTVCSGSPTNITGSVNAVGAWTLTLSNGATVTGTGTTTFSQVVNPTTNTTYTITALSDANCPAQASGLTGSTTVTTQSVTATPVITSSLCGGTTFISGTLSEGNGTPVEVFKNGALLQATTVSKSNWSISGISPSLQPGDVITVKATATGKCSTTTAPMPIQPYLSAPTVNSPLYSGFTTVTGSSSEADGTIIEVFINNTSKIGQGTVSSGVWTATVTALVAKDVVTARATAPGKCQSTSSSPVTVLQTATGASGDYRSAVANGSWTDLSSWEIRSGSNWSTPNTNQGWPGQLRVSGSVNIRTGHSITTAVNVPSALGGLIVDGTLNVNHNITIVNAIPVTVNGAIKFNSTAFISGGGTGSSAVNFTLAQGASLFTAHPSGITLSGTTGSVRTVGTRSFSNDAHFTYNGSIQQETGNGFPGNGIRSLTVDNPGGLRLTQNMQTIRGTTNLQNGALIIPASGTLNLEGPVNITQPNPDGTLRGSISGSATSSLTIGGSGDISILNPLIFSGAPAQLKDFQFLQSGSGATIATDLSVAGTWINNAGNLLNLGTSRITFNGSTTQSIGGTGPTNFTHLTINNSAGVNMNSDARVNGNLDLKAGNLNVSIKVLTLGAAATVTNPGADRMIIASEFAGSSEGELRQIITGPKNLFFPVGDHLSKKYTPVTLNVTSGTGFDPSAYVSIKVRGARHPNNGNLRYYLKRYWLVGSNLTSFNYDFIARYDDIDVVAQPEDESAIAPARWKGQLPWERFPAATINTISNVITITDQAGAGGFTGISTLDPVVTIMANPGTAVCSGTSVTLTATNTNNLPVSYLWSTGSSNSSITVPVTGTQTYTVTLTDENGYTSEGSITLTTSSAATNNTINSPETAVCNGTALATIIGSTPTGGSGSYTYTWQRSFNGINWSRALGTYFEKDYTPVDIPLTATIVYFRRLVNSTGCGQSTSPAISIIIRPLPTATITGTTTICTGQSTTLTISGTPGAAVSYTDGTNTGSVTLIGTGTTGTGTISVNTPAATTTYTLTSVAYADAPTCAQTISGMSATVTVNVKSADPTSATASATTICSGSNTILSLIGGGGGTGEVIKWYTGTCGGTLVGTGNNFTVTPNTTTTYYGRYETSSPCSFNTNCASVTITVLSSEGGTVSGNQTICYNTQPLDLTLSGKNGEVVKWQKSLDAVFSDPVDILHTGITLTSSKIGPLTQNTYFRAEVQNGACTPAISTPILITVRPALTATISGTTTICAGESATLTVNGTPGAKVYYSYAGDGIGSVTLTGGTATINVDAPLATTTYTLTSVEYTDAPVCSQTITGQAATVTVNPRPSATISYAGSPYCASGTVSVTINGQTGGSFSAPVGLSIDATTGAINLATSLANTYTVTYSFSDGSCANTTTTSVTVKALPVVADITGTNTVCVSSTITLGSATANGVWSSSNTGIATVNHTTGAVTGVAAGTATINYTVTLEGCSTTKTKSIAVNANVTAGTISGYNGALCIGNSVDLGTNGASGGTWTSSNTDVATVDPLTGVVTAVGAGPATITYTVEGSCGSPVSTIDIAVNANVTAGTISGYNGALCIGNSVDLGTNGASGGTWTSSNTDVATVDPLTGVVTAVGAGPATITYTVEGSCGSPVSTIDIAVNALPVVADITGAEFVCASSTINLANTTTGGVWSSSNTNFATVDPVSGEVTGVAEGTATITYTVTVDGCTSEETHGVTVGSCPSTISTRTQAQIQEKLVNTMTLKAFPNPTTAGFTVVAESNNLKEKIAVRVMDLYGRTVEIRHNIVSGQTLKLGGQYRPGVYFIEMIQGNNRKQLKLIKQPD